MSLVDAVVHALGYTKLPPKSSVEKDNSVFLQKSERDGVAQNPMAQAYMAMNTQYGLRKTTNVTLQTLRRMSVTNWVDRTCISTLRDEITGIQWDISPINPKEPWDEKFQQFIKELLMRPNRNNENWRTLIDKVVEDVLVVDAGTIEKVRNKNGLLVELWHLDGATIRPVFDTHGVVGNPAYEQYLPGQKEAKPVAQWHNDDVIYIMWNPQGSIDSFGFGMSPVEAGLAVGTAFLYAEAYNLNFFKNNSIPAMIINMGKEVPPAEVDKFRAFLAAEMMGTQGFHQPVVTSFNEGFSVEPLLEKPADMAWEKYVEWQMRWKVALYRMSPQDIGFSLDQYKVEGQVQQQLSKNKAINSLKGVLKHYIDTEIIGDLSFRHWNNNVQFQWIDTEVVDPLKQAQIDDIYLRTGKTSINELRQRDGQDPIMGGVRPLIYGGSTVLPLNPTPLVEDEEGNLQPLHKSVEKVLGAGESEYEYQSTQLDLPTALAKEIKKFAKKIPDADINTQAGGREPDSHVTVVYGIGNTITPEQMRVFAMQEQPIEISLDKVTLFEPEDKDYDVLKIDVVSSGLHQLNENIRSMIGAPGETFKTYTPHITVAYIKKGTCKELVNNTQFQNKKVTIDNLTFSTKKGEKYMLPLGHSVVQKVFDETEGEIIDLQTNKSAIAWMDDRGVTQPLFVTDADKKGGFQIKPAFLDDKKGQEPPEQEVAKLLRAMKVNTPDVKIVSYDQVLQLLPHELYPQFTKWINVEAPFDSVEWRQRWGNTRKSNYYIVTGYITGADLGNHELQVQMATAPEAYTNAVKDLARVWVAERLFYLGDRKPGHYIITTQGNGFGVDYQFYKDKNSYLKTRHFLPRTLAIISQQLADIFAQEVQSALAEIKESNSLEKSYRKLLPKNWERMKGFEDIESNIAKVVQRGIYRWYKKALGMKHRAHPLRSVKKAEDFNSDDSYITNGEYVWQNGIKYPLSVLTAAQIPNDDDINISGGDYREGFDHGAAAARVIIEPNLPEGITVRNAELYGPMFEQRANLVTSTIDDTMKKVVDKIITRGIDEGKTYGMIADEMRSALGLDEDNIDFPQWRAERIARTEAQWAISEGMRQQYDDVGITQVNISPAADACDECVAASEGNPYGIDEAEGLLPIHPNCRCVLVGDYSEFGV